MRVRRSSALSAWPTSAIRCSVRTGSRLRMSFICWCRTDLTNEFNQALCCSLAALVDLSHRPPLKEPGRRGAGRLPLGAGAVSLPDGSTQGRRNGPPPHLPFEAVAPYVV